MAVQRSLAKAGRLMRARRFPEVISLLEPQVFLYRDNHVFYTLLGTACLYVGDFGGSFSYLQRARQLHPGGTEILIGLAAVHIRRRQVTEALQCWLEILDAEPRNAIARRGLALVKTTDDPSTYVTMAESGRLKRFYPPTGFRLPPWIPIAAGIAAVVIAVVILWPFITSALQKPDIPPREGAELATVREFEDGELTNFTSDFRYVLTEQEIEATFSRIGDAFNEFRDNLAQREVNLLLNSNASELVKERSRLVSSYFREPTFVDFSDNFNYEDVAAEPWLYDQCYVRWSGQVSNLDLSGAAITLTLLVGYVDERVLEGIVPVTVPFAADVQAGPIELIGRISLTDEGFALTATSIRRIDPRGGG